jgi:hypothetical protein
MNPHAAQFADYQTLGSVNQRSSPAPPTTGTGIRDDFSNRPVLLRNNEYYGQVKFFAKDAHFLLQTFDR